MIFPPKMWEGLPRVELGAYRHLFSCYAHLSWWDPGDRTIALIIGCFDGNLWEHIAESRTLLDGFAYPATREDDQCPLSVEDFRDAMRVALDRLVVWAYASVVADMEEEQERAEVNLGLACETIEVVGPLDWAVSNVENASRDLVVGARELQAARVRLAMMTSQLPCVVEARKAAASSEARLSRAPGEGEAPHDRADPIF